MLEDWTKMNLAWQQQMLGSSVGWFSIEQVVVAALHAYSPQVHWASGVPNHVDVPAPQPGRPGLSVL